MNATETAQRQARAIRMALGTADAEVTRAPGGGWNVRISDERAKLALDLYDRLGESAVEDTFVTGVEPTHEIHDEAAEFFANGGEAIVCARDGCTKLTGSAADRERYVTERAEQLARAFWTQASDHDLSLLMPQGTASAMVKLTAVFRDLIDRGVLK